MSGMTCERQITQTLQLQLNLKLQLHKAFLEAKKFVREVGFHP
jgi:hypothetical protein